MIAKVVGWAIILVFFAPIAWGIGIWTFLGVLAVAVGLVYAIGLVVTGDFKAPITLLFKG